MSNEVKTVSSNNDIQESQMMASMLEMAANPDIDMDKMSLMLDMQERILNRKSEDSYSKAFSKMKGQLPTIAKKKSNDQTNSIYATIDDISMQVDPILSMSGFAVSYKINQSADNVSAACIIRHSGGHKEETTITLPIDNTGIKGTVNKTKVHGIGSAITYAKRYALVSALGISLGDDDGQSAGSSDAYKPITKLQQETIQNVLDSCSGATKEWFATEYEGIDLINKCDFQKVMGLLKNARATFAKLEGK